MAMRTIVSIVVCVITVCNILAAEDSTFAVRATLSGALMGTMYDAPPTPQSTTSTYAGYALAGRVVWHPNHLLAVGVQSGYMLFSSEDLTVDGETSGNAGLAAIPIQFVITMSSSNFEFGIGLGSYYLQSLWRLRGVQRAESTDFEYGINPWIGYQLPIGHGILLGPEFGAHILSNRGVTSIHLGVRTTTDLLRY